MTQTSCSRIAYIGTPGRNGLIPLRVLCLAASMLLLGKTSAEDTAQNSVRIREEGGFRLVVSNGWPDHAPGAFPRRGNPNTASTQNYHFKMPLRPVAESSPVRRGGWWWGVAVNGVPFEPGTAETWNNEPNWRYEAATGFLDLGLDEHHAHVQPNGSYHYHAHPTGLAALRGGDSSSMLLVGWAADGFPVYTEKAHSSARDLKSALRVMKSSYVLRKGERPGGPSGPGGGFDGRFTQDFEFVPGAGDLDECNGRSGATPEYPGGTYYYCITQGFPFVPRMWKGTPDASFSKGPPGASGGPGTRPPGGPPPRPPGPPPPGKFPPPPR